MGENVIITIIVAVVLIGSAIGGWVRHNRRRLRASFGPEFATVAKEHDTPREVDRELRRRKNLHAELDLRTISPEEQEMYAASWDHVQAAFLDDPALSLSSAEQLVAKLLDTRGYPGKDEDEQLALLSVEHAHALADYRAAQRISRQMQQAPNSTGTEDMRQALLAYHVLFNELLADPDTANAR
jgi:hypothetical protein